MLYKKVWIVLASVMLACTVNAQEWQNDPVVTDTKCVDVSGKKILTFVAKYYLPALAFSETREKAEQELFQSYLMSSALLTRSQYCLAEALGIKGVTDDLKKQQAILTSGTSFEDTKALKEHRKLSENVDKKINKALAKNAELKPEQRKVFAVGSTLYGGATHAFVDLNKAYADYFESNVRSAKGLLSKATADPVGVATSFLKKGGTVAVIGKGVARLWPMTVTTGRDIFEYSQSNDIEVDQDIAAKVGW